jgi:hypothetical protein
MWVGGTLAGVGFITMQAAYVAKFLTEGDSVVVTRAFQQPMLLSSILFDMGIFDAVLLSLLLWIAVQRWRSRRPDRQ